MKYLKKVITFVIITVLTCCSFQTHSYAETAYNEYGEIMDENRACVCFIPTQMSGLRQGDTISIQVKNSGADSLSVYDGYINYNHEYIQCRGIKIAEEDAVTDHHYAVSDDFIYLQCDSGANKGESICHIIFEVKQDFTVTDITFYNGMVTLQNASAFGINDVKKTFYGVSDTVQPFPHLYTDYTYTSPVTDTTITNYINGVVVTQNNIKTNYKSTTLYTDILPSYKYTTNAKGTLVTSTGKVVVGVTSSAQKPDLVKNKIIDKEAAKIAKASIKNGQITVTAGSQPGKAYLWVIDTGDAGVSAYCPITVKMTPTALNTYAIPTDSSEFSYGKAKKYTSAKINVSESTEIYLYPTCNLNKNTTEVKDATYSAAVESKAQDYFTVTKDSSNPYCFIVTAKALQDGKSVSGKIIITCDQNGKKVIFTATACNAVTDININNLANLTSGENIFDLKIGTSKIVKTTGTMQITPTCVSAGDGTTDTLKIYPMGIEAGFDTDKMAAGTVKITKAASAKQKKVAISIGKDKRTLTITSAKGATAGVTSYFLLVYNTTNSNGKSGYKVVSVTTE